MAQNILLTGIPRSGTTLSCTLLNQLPDVVALVEPMDVRGFTSDREPTEWLHIIEQFLTQTRVMLIKQGCAQGRVLHGSHDNTFSAAPDASGLRQAHISPGVVHVDKPLTADFTLLIKHPNAFTAMLPTLTAHYPCFALIRNPVAVLASWNSVNIPLQQGHAPAAEAADPVLKKQLARISDTTERQLTLLDWYYRQYQQHLPAAHILRYEAVIQTQGQSLNIVTGRSIPAAAPLTSRNHNSLYDTELMAALRSRLIKRGGVFEDFYPVHQLQDNP